MGNKPKLAEVKTLYKSNYRDIPSSLRAIADQIERGDYGDVSEGVLVINGADLEIFGFGNPSDSASTHLLLSCAAFRMVVAATTKD